MAKWRGVLLLLHSQYRPKGDTGVTIIMREVLKMPATMPRRG